MVIAVGITVFAAVSTFFARADVPVATFARVDYVQATHSQYIDTGYQPNAKTTIAFRFSVDDYSARVLASDTGLTERNSAYVLACYNDRCQFAYGDPGFCGFGDAYSNTVSMDKDTAIHELGVTNGVFFVDGVQKYDASAGKFKTTPQKSLYVFALNADGTPKFLSSAKVYSLVISENGEVKHDYVPVVRRSDKTPGLYDVVADKFLVSATGTSLTAPEIPDNDPIPEDPTLKECNVWIAKTDGLASVGANWSYGRPPVAEDKVLFSGDYSDCACTWDADAENGPSATIAELTLQQSYTKSITILTTFPEVAASSFHVFSVTGDATVRSGSLVHGRHDATHKADYYRLRLDVGGDLTVASGASISGDGRGSFGKRSTGGDGSYGGCYNGKPAWGSLKEPYGVGASSSSGDGKGNYPAWGGGAIWIEVAGATALDGTIACEGVHVKTQFDSFSGSGGAVYLKTKSLSGTGVISGSAAYGDRSSNSRSGAGGRVAVVLTETELTDFPVSRLRAFSSVSSYENVGGAGTVFVKTPAKPNGILYLKDRSDKYNLYGYRPKVNQLTDIPANDSWTLDGIIFGDNAILRIPANATLILPGGLASVSSTTSTRESGILVDGGSLVLPSGDQTISGCWTFHPTGYAIPGSLTVTAKGAVGSLPLYVSSRAHFRLCNLTVVGDVMIDATGYILAQQGGYISANENVPGGSVTTCFGGQNGLSNVNAAYGSVFNPVDGGACGTHANNAIYDCGGGAVKLSVGGTLTLNGLASSQPQGGQARPGAAGSINITAARLEGSGSINANGGMGNNYWTGVSNSFYGGSGGGRIAVRLTDPEAEFTDAWITRITAKGRTCTKSDGLNGRNSSSAGTVYLQTASDGEKKGTIIIRSDNENAANGAWTALPSKDAGSGAEGTDAVADFKDAILSLRDRAQVRLFGETGLRFKALELLANTKLDLNGKTLTVNKAVVGGVKLKAGVYAASDAALQDFVSDSSEDASGRLSVTGGGLVIVVR